MAAADKQVRCRHEIMDSFIRFINATYCAVNRYGS